MKTTREIEIGRELFAYIKMKQSCFDLKSLFLKISTFDQKLQTQLFKFVDVLPNLKEKESIVKLLSEYIDESKFKMGFLIRALARLPILNDLSKSLITNSVKSLARIFICGVNVEEAKKTISKLAQKNQSYTLDLLGEVVLSEAEAEHYYQKYIELLENIPKVNISVKLSALVSQLNSHNFEQKKLILKEKLTHLYRLAQKTGSTVNVDSEHYSWHELIFSVVKEVLEQDEFRDFTRAGIVIQAYLKESEDDLKQWLAWLKLRQAKITIRLVKGAYWDYEQAHALQKSWTVPVFERKYLTDANYEKLTRILLENIAYARPAFASHNVRSLAYALKIVEEKKINKEDFEVQMLYGMLDDLKDYFSTKGYCLRVYLPYGELLPGMSYLVRRLLENTANDSFLKQGFIDKRSQEELLQAPATGHGEHRCQVKSVSSLRGGAQRRRGNPSSSKAFKYLDCHSAKANHNDADCLKLKVNDFQNSADINFETEAQREKFKKFLFKTRTKLSAKKNCPIIVAGEEQFTTETFTSINPANTEEVLATVFKASTEDCSRAIAQAQDIQKQWAQVDVRKRAKVLTSTAKAFEEKREYLNSILILETGKAWHEADAETSEAIDFLNYYAQQALDLFSVNKLRSLPGEKNTNYYQAHGLSLIISPWNFPLAIMLGMTVASLVSGNAVLVKPSSQTCLIAYEALIILLENIKKTVGAEYIALVSLLPGSGSVIGEYLIHHQAVRSIAFTGSNKTGLHIGDIAAQARPPKAFVAEMGGKNPIIVDKTADLDEALPGVINSAFGFSGQKCSACSRVIVDVEIYDEFKSRLVEALTSIKASDPLSYEAYMGPVIDKSAFENIHEYIKLAYQQGEVICYQESDLKQGYFINPLVVENLQADAKVTKEEVFGPVLALYKARDLTDAIKIANDTEFGLTAGLFSRSPNNIKRSSLELEAGNVYINRTCTGALVSRQAFGGLKNSSIGFKAGGPNYLLQFVREKTVTENTMRRGFADN